MCDTFGVVKKDKCIFGKNSDRSPNEPQVIQFIKGHKNKDKKIKVTYIEIDEVPVVNSILISRPSWMWGCEMGVNEHGVCIGNEAVFTKGKYNKTGLTGMDLVRLALERSNSAEDAKEIIINLIQKYNQGGNCGYDHNFFYDNSFLIMDRKEMYILETHGKRYNIKKANMWAISNCYTIHDMDDLKEDKIFKFFSCSATRNKLVKNNLNENIGVKESFDILRLHHKNNYFKKGSVSSPCMHAGALVGDHTTSSMVIELGENIDIYFTGTSLPCISLFKYYKFGDPIDTPIFEDLDIEYWYKQEFIRRKIIDKKLPREFYKKRDKYEEEIINKKIKLKKAIEYENELNKILKESKESNKTGLYYKNYWKNKSKILEENYYA